MNHFLLENLFCMFKCQLNYAFICLCQRGFQRVAFAFFFDYIDEYLDSRRVVDNHNARKLLRHRYQFKTSLSKHYA